MVYREIIVSNISGEGVKVESMGKDWVGKEIRIESCYGNLMMFLEDENGDVIEMWEIRRDVIVKMVSVKGDWREINDEWKGRRGE
jgi:hypothetical protein